MTHTVGVDSKTTRIICRQLAPAIADLNFNHQMTCAAIEESTSLGGQVIVLPELVTSGYVFESVREAKSLAITPAHQIFRDWTSLAAAGAAVVIAGFCELGEDGAIYNSAAVVDGRGVRAIYRKLHLWDAEKNFFTPGSAVPPVVPTAHGLVGVVICYDLEFPEITRTMALAGAELLAVPTNWPLVYRPDGERPPEVQIGIAAARVNRMAIACCDRMGTERGQEWTGGTTIINEAGWVVATSGTHDVATADLDLRRAQHKELTHLAHVFGDRRPEFYGALSQLKA